MVRIAVTGELMIVTAIGFDNKLIAALKHSNDEMSVTVKIGALEETLHLKVDKTNSANFTLFAHIVKPE